MQKYARIQDSIVAETVTFNPAGLYHESLVWVPCPDGVDQQWHYDGVGFTPPEMLPPVEPDESGLVYAQAAKVIDAKVACDAVLAPLGVEYGPWETATWDQQYTEAVALMADPTLEAVPASPAEDKIPLIRSLTASRSTPERTWTIPEIAQRIIRNRETWSVLTGHVVGQRLAIVDRINACTTLEQLAAVDVTITLPG